MKCRHCLHELSMSCLDLGTSPPSNSYVDSAKLAEPEVYFPLRLLLCENCFLVQTEDFARKELFFNDDYAYFSSYSSSWLKHAEDYVREMQQRFNLNTDSMVTEVAANDGYLLQYVKAQGIPCYGIEPTASTAKAARERGINIIEAFFGETLGTDLAKQGRQADLMVANNVLAHVPDINDFVRGFEKLLKPDGIATFEFPHLLNMVASNQFDTAYHEHFSYLSLTTVNRIVKANGLQLFDVQELPTHGGSLRIFVQKGDAHRVESSVDSVLNKERSAGMATINFYTDFQTHAESAKNALLSALLEFKSEGLKVAAYGAAAKGNTFINFAGVRSDLIQFVVDKNPQKQGRYMPGSRIPIVDLDHLVKERPDRIVILPWNLKAEIQSELAFVRDWGAKFVVGIPELSIF